MERTAPRLLSFALGFGLTAGVVYLLGTKFYGVWLPLALPLCVYMLLGLLPRVQAGRVAYSASIAGGVLTAWFLTRERLPWERWDLYSRYAPYISLALGIFGLVWWFVAASASARRPSVGWLLALALCAWGIAFFSSAKGGADQTEAWLIQVFGLAPDTAHSMNVVVRKIIHYGFYGLVGLFGLLAARRSGATKPAIFALLIALSYASFDEVRQSYVPGRTSSALDVGLDMAGAATFVALGSGVRRKVKGEK